MSLAEYTCYRATGPVALDGKLDSPDWRAAERSTAFVDIVSGDPAWFDTRVAMLWDDECLYFGFTAEEPRVWATLTERDSKIWLDNDLEIFIAGEDAYYEFEVNAFNTVYEVFWIWKDMYYAGSPYHVPEWNPAGRRLLEIDGIGGHVHPRGWRYGFLDWDFPGLRSAVHTDGGGWKAEVALPWAGTCWLADGRPLPPKEGDVWRIDCSRFQHFGPRGERLDPAAGWTWNRHGYYDSHMPETFSYVRFSADSVLR